MFHVNVDFSHFLSEMLPYILSLSVSFSIEYITQTISNHFLSWREALLVKAFLLAIRIFFARYPYHRDNLSILWL